MTPPPRSSLEKNPPSILDTPTLSAPPAQLIDFVYEVSETDIDELVQMSGIGKSENTQLFDQLIRRRRDIISQFDLREIDAAGRARRLSETADHIHKRRESRPPRPQRSEKNYEETPSGHHELLIRTALAADGDKIKNQSIDIIEQSGDRLLISFRLTKEHWRELLYIWRYEGDRSKIAFSDSHEPRNFIAITPSEDFTRGNARLKLSLGSPSKIADGLVHIEVDHAGDPRSMIDVEYLIREVLDISNGVDRPKKADVDSYKEARYRYVHKLDPEAIEHHGRPITECVEALTSVEVYPEYHTFIEPGRAERLSRQSPFILFHTVYESSKIPSILKNGLACTTERFERGAHIPGMSCEADILSGGADSVFLRMDTLGRLEKRHPQDIYGLDSYSSSRSGALLFDPSLIDRTDHYCYEYDQYGSKEPDIYSRRITAETLHEKISLSSHTSCGNNELMFQRGIGPEAIRAVLTDDLRGKYSFEQALLAAGQETIGDIPVYDFVRYLPTEESVYRLLYPESVTTSNLTREIVVEAVNRDDYLSALEVVTIHITDQSEAQVLFLKILREYNDFLIHNPEASHHLMEVDSFIATLWDDTNGIIPKEIMEYHSLTRESSSDLSQLVLKDYRFKWSVGQMVRQLKILQKRSPDMLADILIHKGQWIYEDIHYSAMSSDALLREWFDTALDHLISIGDDERSIGLIRVNIEITPPPASIYRSLQVLVRKPEMASALKQLFRSHETTKLKKDILLEILLAEKNDILAEELVSERGYKYQYDEYSKVNVAAIRDILEGDLSESSDWIAAQSQFALQGVNKKTKCIMLSALLQQNAHEKSGIIRALINSVGPEGYAELFPHVSTGLIDRDTYFDYLDKVPQYFLDNVCDNIKMLFYRCRNLISSSKQTRDRVIHFLRKDQIKDIPGFDTWWFHLISVAIDDNDPDRFDLLREYVSMYGVSGTSYMQECAEKLSTTITFTEYQQLPPEMFRSVEVLTTLIERFCSEGLHSQVEELIAGVTGTPDKKHAVGRYVRTLAGTGHIDKARFYAQSIKDKHIRDACLGEIAVGMTTTDPTQVREMLRSIRNPHTRTTYLYEAAKGHLRVGDRDRATRLIGRGTSYENIRPVNISSDRSTTGV